MIDVRGMTLVYYSEGCQGWVINSDVSGIRTSRVKLVNGHRCHGTAVHNMQQQSTAKVQV